ncbi:MAG: exosome complex RNA-binding protein Rrp4 [Candidatus Woesearchaeota archaeon]|nr:exosome complex RNA-binding protein Rrp4 [Candidatus Woesearchaeota archaeon]
MSGIKVKEKEIVVPGEIIAEGMDYLPSFGTYRLGETIRAMRLGIVSIDGKVVKIIPLSGRYMPKYGDVIIAEVVDVLLSGWRLNINSAYYAMLSVKDATSKFIEKSADLTKIFNLGDYLVCKVINVTSQKLVDVTTKLPGLKKLEGGRIIEINTNKVPRIIGKGGSMITMIKDMTGCRITVGQNGLVWVQGEPENEIVAINAIKKAEEEAHTEGLTDKIKKFLEEEMKKIGKTAHIAHKHHKEEGKGEEGKGAGGAVKGTESHAHHHTSHAASHTSVKK